MKLEDSSFSIFFSPAGPVRVRWLEVACCNLSVVFTSSTSLLAEFEHLLKHVFTEGLVDVRRREAFVCELANRRVLPQSFDSQTFDSRRQRLVGEEVHICAQQCK